MKITVLGSGAWGTALAMLLLENGNDVTLWSFLEEESRVLRETHENPFLKGVKLPDEMKFTTDMAAVKGCGLVVVATPSFAVRSTASYNFPNCFLFCLSLHSNNGKEKFKKADFGEGGPAA